MISLPVTFFSLLTSISGLGVLGLYIGSARYDLRTIKRFRHMHKKPNAKAFRSRPLVTVVIQTANNASVIGQSLESILKSTYRKYEILVIDNASTDETVRLMRDVKARYPKKLFTVTTKRKPAPQNEITKIIKRKAKGDLLIHLQPGTHLQPETIKRAVRYFQADSDLVSIVGRSVAFPKQTMTSQAIQLADVVRGRLAKAKSGFGIAQQTAPIVAQRANATVTNSEYASDVIVCAKRVRPRPQSSPVIARIVIWLMWAVLTLGVAYIWYVALQAKVVEPLGILWAGAAVIGLLFTMSDDYLPFRRKLYLISLMPVWYIFSCLYMLGRALSPLSIFTRVRVKVTVSLAP